MSDELERFDFNCCGFGKSRIQLEASLVFLTARIFN